MTTPTWRGEVICSEQLVVGDWELLLDIGCLRDEADSDSLVWNLKALTSPLLANHCLLLEIGAEGEGSCDVM